MHISNWFFIKENTGVPELQDIITETILSQKCHTRGSESQRLLNEQQSKRERCSLAWAYSCNSNNACSTSDSKRRSQVVLSLSVQ